MQRPGVSEQTQALRLHSSAPTTLPFMRALFILKGSEAVLRQPLSLKMNPQLSFLTEKPSQCRPLPNGAAGLNNYAREWIWIPGSSCSVSSFKNNTFFFLRGHSWSKCSEQWQSKRHYGRKVKAYTVYYTSWIENISCNTEKLQRIILFSMCESKKDMSESWQLQTEGNQSSWDTLHKWAMAKEGEGSYGFF